MINLQDDDKNALRKLGVAALYLFGSRAAGVEGPLSDYDFGILLKDSSLVKPGNDTQKLYQALYDFLSPLCPRTLENDVIDIIFLQSGVSLELQAHIVRDGKVLFDENPILRADYEAQVMMRMADFQPILNIFDQAILDRI